MDSKDPKETVTAEDIVKRAPHGPQDTAADSVQKKAGGVPGRGSFALEETTIKFKGFYDLDGLYRFMTNWLRRKRFEIHETVYKFRPPELEIRFYGERKFNSIAMQKIDIYYHGWGEFDLDVMVKGKPKKMANTRFVLTIGGGVETAYENLFGEQGWSKSLFERKLLGFFQGWVIYQDIGSIYWDELYYEMYRFQGGIKDFLKLEAKGNVY